MNIFIQHWTHTNHKLCLFAQHKAVTQSLITVKWISTSQQVIKHGLTNMKKYGQICHIQQLLTCKIMSNVNNKTDEQEGPEDPGMLTRNLVIQISMTINAI